MTTELEATIQRVEARAKWPSNRVAANTDILRVLAELRRLQAEVFALRAADGPR